MKKTSLLLTSLLAMAATQAMAFPTTARVLRADPTYHRVDTPRQECHTEEVQQQVQAPAATNSPNYGGSLVGGLVGGLLGSQVGGGNGKTAAAVAGALGGAYVGNSIAGGSNGSPQNNQSYTQTVPVQRCTTVNDSREELQDYAVVYTYGGHEYTTHMARNPGKTLPVEVSVTPSY